MKSTFLKTDIRGRVPKPFRRKDTKDGTFYIRFTVDGKRYLRSCYTTSRREAEAHAYRVWFEMQNLTVQSIYERPAIRLDDVWEYYENTERHKLLAQSTQSTRKRNFDAFLKWCHSRQLLTTSGVTSEIIIEYLNWRDTKNKTFNNLLNELETIITAVDDRCAPAFKKVERRSITRGQKASTRFRNFTDEEIDLIDAALPKSKLKFKDEWRDASRTAYNTALRYKDIALLSEDKFQVDEIGEYLELAPHKTTNKTIGRVVNIRLTSEMREIRLRRLTLNKTGYLFPNLAAEYATKGDKATQPFNDFLKRIGIKNASFHCYRVTVVTKADEAEVDLKEFGGVTGQSTKAQTQAYNRNALNIDMEAILHRKTSS